MLALVAPYEWSVARFFAEALIAPNPDPGPAAAEVVDSLRGRSADAPPDDPALMVALLGPEGPLAGALPDYEHREPQLQMLLAVAQIQARGGILVVEAGTGTGKSLAYLVPSIARAVRHGERAVVSTNTHTLQEQLMAKDLPGLRAWLPWDFKAVLLKGRSNYVSLRRWRRFLAEPCKDAEELRFKLKILIWLHSTESGDRSELRLHGREEVMWANIASDPLDCVGIHCTKEDCYVHRARAEAEAADLVVVNHALLLADAEVGGGLLPEFDHLVVDEAHHLEDAATRGLRQEVDGPGLLALLDRLASTPGAGLLAELQRQPHLGSSENAFGQAIPMSLAAGQRVRDLFQGAAQWVAAKLGDLERRDESLRLTPALREDDGWAQLSVAGENAVTALSALDVGLRHAVAGVRDCRLAAPRPRLRRAPLHGFHVGDPRGRRKLRLLQLARGTRSRDRGVDPSLSVRFPPPGPGLPSHRSSVS
jgi:DNA polymerase-3 subunit epsilon/ATP-dependent DNA helicase DinG